MTIASAEKHCQFMGEKQFRSSRDWSKREFFNARSLAQKSWKKTSRKPTPVFAQRKRRIARPVNFYSAAGALRHEIPLARENQREKGYMAQPMPTPTSRKSKSVQKMYLTRSLGWRRPRNPKETEITRAKITKACRCVSFTAIRAISADIADSDNLNEVMLCDLARLHRRAG